MNKLQLIIIFALFAFVVHGQSVSEPDYLGILKRSASYDTGHITGLPQFTYQSSNDPDLKALRKRYNLDSIAGFGNETSRLLNLMHWVHNTVMHDGQHESGIKNINAGEILNAAITKRIAVCCGELASTLNDCYLAMGWASRKIYCFPKDSLGNDNDSHVINIVYLSSTGKWIWLDPTNDAYIMDENGDLLGIAEVRKRLTEGKTLIVNPDANWNHKSSITKDYYLGYYMAKNLYRFYCPLASEYDYETLGRNRKVVYICLWPPDYQKELPFRVMPYYKPELKTTFEKYNIYNSEVFFQKPDE